MAMMDFCTNSKICHLVQSFLKGEQIFACIIVEELERASTEPHHPSIFI